jgi:hypothetical protein
MRQEDVADRTEDTFVDSRELFADAREIIAAAMRVVVATHETGDVIQVEEPFETFQFLIENAEAGLLGALALTAADWIIDTAHACGQDPAEFYAAWVLEWVRTRRGV